MAIFPQGLTAIDQRCNAGERRVLHQLKRCLEDDYIVWHDIPIGPRARQPDFVILQQGPSTRPESREHLARWTRAWADAAPPWARPRVTQWSCAHHAAT